MWGRPVPRSRMVSWVWVLTLTSSLWHVGDNSRSRKLETFRSKTELNHLVVDDVSGTVYVGSVNALYQLTPDLQLVHAVETGPALDNKKCTPPIEPSQCQEAVDTDNVNKLLLLDRPGGRLVECGSLFKGICALRELGNISHRIFYEDSSGEKSFVASNDERVSTVGLVTSVGKGDDDSGPAERVLFVGKGNGPHDNGIIISTRLLDRKDGKEAFEAYTDHTAFKAGYLSANTQQFVAVFEDGDYVFFIFNQQDKQPAKNRTLVARMCKNDPFYYSYFEMDLECHSGSGEVYGVCHAAFVATLEASPGAGRVLFAVFSKDSKGGSGSPRSALCLFPLGDIHQKMEENRNKCYTGAQGSSSQTFYKPFHGEVQCVSHGPASLSFRCGSEHLPYPLGSRDGLVSTATLQRDGMNLTAVTVTTENGHTVVLLGTSDGRILKVFLTADGTSTEYGSIPVELNKRIERDLLLSANGTSLYVMTQDKVFRLPVQECLLYQTCDQCQESRDPYCGWCVLEDRCTRKIDCLRAKEENHWLWSRGNSCVAVTSAQPQNMSRRAQGEVRLTVSPLPALTINDSLQCRFGDSPAHPARVEGDTIICDSPSSIPKTPPGQDHVEVQIMLTFLRTPVFLTSHMYPFYDCKEAMSLAENIPCISCASNRWNCQWDLKYHECRESSPNPEEGIIKSHMEENCPQFLNPSPLVIPMNYETTVNFEGKNLDPVKMPSLHAGSEKLKFETSVTTGGSGTFTFTTPKLSYDGNETLPLNLYIKSYGKNIDSRLEVTLYNCSFGRSDCSLCLAANPAYHCVWCGSQNQCVYEALCSNITTECPPPVITKIEPETGPLGGGIRVTILGSNLGIQADDVKRITVAGKDCAFQKAQYSVSTRIVCEVDASKEPITGGIEVDINGKLGQSPPHVQFTYQQPVPMEVKPTQGPQAGGTTLVISGSYLDTGSSEDVRVILGTLKKGVPCQVYVSPPFDPQGALVGGRRDAPKERPTRLALPSMAQAQ